jgi:hypothetical protein
MGQQVTLIAPIDLSLSTRHHLETTVQTAQRVLVPVGEFGRDARPGLGQEHLDPLVVAGEAVLGDQPLMHHRAFDGQIGPQPPLHQRDEPGNQQRLRAHPGRAFRRNRGSILGQILTNRPPITAALTTDLSKRGACSMQGAETTNIHPGLRIQDHEQVTLRARLLGGRRTEG